MLLQSPAIKSLIVLLFTQLQVGNNFTKVNSYTGYKWC